MKNAVLFLIYLLKLCNLDNNSFCKFSLTNREYNGDLYCYNNYIYALDIGYNNDISTYNIDFTKYFIYYHHNLQPNISENKIIKASLSNFIKNKDDIINIKLNITNNYIFYRIINKFTTYDILNNNLNLFNHLTKFNTNNTNNFGTNIDKTNITPITLFETTTEDYIKIKDIHFEVINFNHTLYPKNTSIPVLLNSYSPNDSHTHTHYGHDLNKLDESTLKSIFDQITTNYPTNTSLPLLYSNISHHKLDLIIINLYILSLLQIVILNKSKLIQHNHIPINHIIILL